MTVAPQPNPNAGRPVALSPAELRKLAARLEKEAARRIEENALQYYQPYARQLDFHAAGATHRERLLMAGNQLGKTWAGGMEVAMHACGRYPDWWVGKRFNGQWMGRWCYR